MTVLANAVPDTRQINGQLLSSDVTLTPDHVGAVKGEQYYGLVVQNTADTWQKLACVRIPQGSGRQGAGTIIFNVYGSAGFNAGHPEQCCKHEIIIRSGNGSPKGLSIALYRAAGMAWSIKNVAWQNISNDDYDIYVQTGILTNATFVTYQSSDTCSLLSWGGGLVTVTKPSNVTDGTVYQTYHSGYLPPLNLLNVYSKQEVNDKIYVTRTFQKPEGAIDGKYYPVILKWSAIGYNIDVKVGTYSGGGSYPMNSCLFAGQLQSGGWGDTPSSVWGSFSIYDTTERAISGIAMGSKGSYPLAVFYVEARAFPVKVTTLGIVDVSVSATDYPDTDSVYRSGISLDDENVGTNVVWISKFNAGNGIYFNKNKVCDRDGGSVFGKVNGINTLWTGSVNTGQSISIADSLSGSTVFLKFNPGTNWSAGIIVPPGQTAKISVNYAQHWYILALSNYGRTIQLESCSSGAPSLEALGTAV